MSISVTKIGSHRVISCAGPLDISTLPRLSDALERHVGAGSSVVVDLDGITVVDSTTVGVLLGAAARQRETSSRFTVVCSNREIVARLEQLGLVPAVPLATSVHDIASD